MDVQRGEILPIFADFLGSASAVAFSPDSELFASVTSPDQSFVWDFNSGQALFAIPGHTRGIFGAAISPDGRYLATASRDGTARIFLLDLDELMNLALARLTRWFTIEECRLYLHTEVCPPFPGTE